MVSITIDTVPVNNEHPIEFLKDGTEDFNLGTFKLINLTKRTAYPDYADVVVTINSVDYEAIIQQDLITRTGVGRYQHEITLAEPVIKLSQYIMADRYYTTIDGSIITYEDQLDNILATHDFGNTSPFTVATATRTLLDRDAPEKEYSGGDLLTTLTDMFRSVNAVPTLSLNNVIGHEAFGELGTLINPSSATYNQLLDNRNDFSAWTIDANGGVDGDYIKLLHGPSYLTKYKSADIVTTLVIGTTYTVLYKITENTCQSAQAFYLHNNGITEYTSLEKTVGTHTTLTVANGTTGEVQFVSYNGLNDEYITFRAVLFEGDLTGLKEAEKEDLIDNAKYGTYYSKILITDMISETITSDISDYGLAVYSKVKNATYEGDSIVDGGTYFPSSTEGITPRTAKVKWDDEDAEYFLDSGIRRAVQVLIVNLDSQTLGTITNAQIGNWVLPKEEWDDLEIERTIATLKAGKYKNNTLYYNEGDSIIKNVGVKYLNSGALVTGDDALEWLIRSYWVAERTTDAEYNSQNIKDVEMQFYYQAVRDMDVRVERHNTERVTKNATLINNQKDSKLELQRYGKALKSQINRVGNDTYEITLRYNESSAFSVYEVNDYTADGYKIVKVQFLARNSSLDVTYLLVKNAHILNPFTAVNRSVSPFTVTKRNILSCFTTNEYLEFSGTSRTDDGLLSSIGKRALLNGLKWNATYDTPIYNAQFISASSSSIKLNMSAIGFALGQSLVFNAQFQEPKVAGYQFIADDGGISGYRMKPIAYTDAYGQVNTFTMKFYNDLPSVPNDLPIGTTAANTILDSDTYTVGLNPNEILAMSRHIHCISDRQNLIIGDYFSENNSLIKLLSLQQGTTIAVYPATIKHTIYDRYAKAGSTSGATYAIDSAYKELTISSVPTGSSWILCKSTSPFDIYLAFNYEDADMNTIYINSLEDRPNIETL